MCNEADYCYAVQESVRRKARKPHECCACHEPILPGHVYVRSFAVPPAHQLESAESYKHCLRCWEILKRIQKERPGDAIAWRLDCGEYWIDAIGELPDDVAALAFMTADEAQQQLVPH